MGKKTKQNRFPIYRIIARDLCAFSFAALVVLSVWVLEATPEPVMERQSLQFELLSLNNGIYRGSYGTAGNEYAVEIAIEAHRIEAISVIDAPERVLAKKCGLCDALAMIKETIATQSLPVDAYSGATQTTTAIKHALEAALSSPFEGANNAPSHTEAWR
jgi:uncharacterized protein with FMN-binding domain